jgi:hypothetical protein
MQVGLLFHGVLPDIAVYGLFPLLGMASMMAATFQAPLTALIAVLEMTHSSQAMLPSLVVITLSCLITRLVLHQDSVFVERLHAMGMVSSWDPVQKLLRHSDLRSLCESVVQLPRLAPPERLREINASMIDFVLIEHLGQTSVTGREELLSVFEQWRLGPQPWLSNDDQEVQLDLARMGSWQSVLVVPAPDTPAEALALMNRHHCDRLVLQFEQGLGLVSRYQIDKLLLKD